MATVKAKPSWLNDPDLQGLMDLLGPQNVRIVGGAVRDHLLGRPVGDIDMATTHAPDDVINILEGADVRVIPTGLDHGTVMAVLPKRHVEITTLRSDTRTDGRRAKVAFHDDWERDAARRDFTINALYMNADGTVMDPVGGLADIAGPTIRFIGTPESRIHEDVLRVLRYFRFHAQLGLTLDITSPDFKACATAKDKLATLSRERVRDEILKTLSAPTPTETINAMRAAGVLEMAIGGTDLTGLDALIALEEACEAIDVLRRLTLLWRGRDVGTAGRELRLSNAEVDRLVTANMMLIETAPVDAVALRVALYHEGVVGFQDRLLLGAALSGGDVEETVNLFKVASTYERPELPVTGADLLARGVDEGPELGAMLQALEERWIASDFTMGKQDLLKSITH